ncbi:MAG: hypothetical protein NTY77_18150 [Elusimicrobia bacterium]|nr:hypothetical protein [Elusimicrobiota bacterium]
MRKLQSAQTEVAKNERSGEDGEDPKPTAQIILCGVPRDMAEQFERD